MLLKTIHSIKPIWDQAFGSRQLARGPRTGHAARGDLCASASVCGCPLSLVRPAALVLAPWQSLNR